MTTYTTSNTGYPWHSDTFYPQTLTSTTTNVVDYNQLQGLLGQMQRTIHDLQRSLLDVGRMHGEMVNAIRWLSVHKDKTYDDYLKFVQVKDTITDALSQRTYEDTPAV